MYPPPPSSLRFEHRGQKLELRVGQPRDVEALLEAIRDSLPELQRFQLWAHQPATLQTEFQFQRLIDSQKAFLEGRDFIFHLWGEQRILGGFGLHPRALNPRALEIGYWIRSSEAGRGLATACVRQLIHYNFETLGNERLQVCVNTNNKASQRVVDKIGFHLEGELRYFEGQPTESQRAAGIETAPTCRISALTVDDLSHLDWYPCATRPEIR